MDVVSVSSSSSSNSTSDSSEDEGDGPGDLPRTHEDKWRRSASAKPAPARTEQEWADSCADGVNGLPGFTERENAALTSMSARQPGAGRQGLWCSVASLGARPGAARVGLQLRHYDALRDRDGCVHSCTINAYMAMVQKTTQSVFFVTAFISKLWAAEATRRLLRPLAQHAADSRETGTVFSTPQGHMAVVGHCGMAAPRTARHGEGRAPACVAQLLSVLKAVDSCKMALVLGDLNTQKRSARIDTNRATAPDAAEKLWVRTVREAKLVDPMEVLGIKGAWSRRQGDGGQPQSPGRGGRRRWRTRREQDSPHKTGLYAGPGRLDAFPHPAGGGGGGHGRGVFRSPDVHD